ncbi:MAG: permease [Oscillospiraceae bacterium]|nr:permease [Oscillospiraceae bacterium]
MKINHDNAQENTATPQPKTGLDLSVLAAILVITVLVAYLLFSCSRVIDTKALEQIQIFNTIFISILMQAFPFMLIGIFVSAAMEVFAPDQFVTRVFPSRFGLGFITAMFAGLLFPVCECAIVPVTTRLVKKGVALPIAVTFMLSAPIINPIVIVSTLYAFAGQPQVALLRVVFGLAIALLVGGVLYLLNAGNDVLLTGQDDCGCHCHDHCACCAEPLESLYDGGETAQKTRTILQKLKEMFLHAGEEFFGVGRYLILGAFLTSLIQILVPRAWFAGLNEKSGIPLLMMMLIAFLFSACSTSDAFIAKSFAGRFSLGAIMGFLVFGPMMDIKNILMLLGNFKKKFAITLVLIIFISNFFMLYFFAFLF